jgi:hypothetical protein
VVKAWTAAIRSIQTTIAFHFRRPQGADFHFQGVYQRRVFPVVDKTLKSWVSKKIADVVIWPSAPIDFNRPVALRPPAERPIDVSFSTAPPSHHQLPQILGCPFSAPPNSCRRPRQG